MPDFGELRSAFESLGLARSPVIAHAALRPFGPIPGGAETVLKSMFEVFDSLVMPTFTYNTMVTPQVGPPNNGISYGRDQDNNKRAETFRLDMPSDKMMGILPRMLLEQEIVSRTSHPILSFGGYNADDILATQTLYDPFAPIGVLAERDGWVVLINVDHTVNTSIHYAERLAGRRTFLRWALLDSRVVECSNFPGDSSGFQAIEEHISTSTRRVDLSDGFIKALPLAGLVDVVQRLIRKQPLALLCERLDCERCNAVRATGSGSPPPASSPPPSAFSGG